MKRLLALLLLAVPALATTKTVKSGGGGDFTTIQACSTAMAAGDICVVFAGTYNEDVTVSSGTAGNYKLMTVNPGDVVNVYSFAIGSHVKINGFVIHHDASPIANPCVSINSGGQTDYYITNNIMRSCGVYMIKEDAASNTTHGYIQRNTLSYSCSTAASPNTCTAMQINGDYHLIENNDISHVSDGPYVFGQHNVIRNNTFHDITDTDCGSNSGNCHVDFIQNDANVVGGAQPAAYELIENNTITNMVNTGTFVGANMHAGALLQAEVCSGGCQNAIYRFNTAAHIAGGGNTNDNSGVAPPPQAWINVKNYNNDWVDMLVGITSSGQGINGHDYGSTGWSHLNELYQIPFASANQTNPYYCYIHNSPCTPSSYGNNLAWTTGGNGSAQLFGHTYGSGAFTADSGNVFSDPQFVNYAGNNFALVPGSPAVAGGTFLTTVAGGDSGTGTSLVVADAGFFQDGSGITGVNGDCISVTTVGNHVCITSVNYSTNTLTLASSITRSSGDHIWLYSDSTGRQVLQGAAPNIGSQFGPMAQVYVQTEMKEENTGVTYQVLYPRHFLNGAEDLEYFQPIYESVDLSNANVTYNGSSSSVITQSGHTNSLVAGDTFKVFNITGVADGVCIATGATSGTITFRPDQCQSANQPWMTTTGGGVTLNSGAFAWKTDGPGMDPSGTAEIINTGSDTTAKYFLQNQFKTAGSGSCSMADMDLHKASCYETHPVLSNAMPLGIFLQIAYGNAQPTCTYTPLPAVTVSSTISFDLKFTTNQGAKSNVIHFVVCADGAGSGKLGIPFTHPGYRQSFASETHPILATTFGSANQYGTWTITPDSAGSGNATIETFLAPATDGFIKHAGAQKPLAIFHSNTRENVGYTITFTPDADNTTADYTRIFVPDHTASGGAKPPLNPQLVEQTPCAVDPVMTAAGGADITVGTAGGRTTNHLYNINTNTLTWGTSIRIFNDGTGGSPTTFNEYWEIYPPTNTASFASDFHTPALYICGVPNPTTGEIPFQDGAGAVGRSNVGNFTGVGNLLTINGVFSTPAVDNYTGNIQPVHNLTVAGLGFLHDNANPAYFHYAPGDTTRSGAHAPYSNGNAVRPFATQKFSGIGLYASEVANPLFSDCNGNGGWLRNCTLDSTWEGNYLTLYGNTGSFTEHPFYVQDERAVVWLNFMAGSVVGSNGAAYGSLRTGRGYMMWNRGFPAGLNETASVNMGDSSIQDYSKYMDIQNTYGPTPAWGGSGCSNGSTDYPLCGASPAFGGMNTIAAMQTEHTHSFFYISNTAKMSTGDCAAGIADTNASNSLAGQHLMFYNGNNVVCPNGGVSLLELERPPSGGSNDMSKQVIAPTLAWVHNSIAWWQTTNPCNTFGVEVNHGKTTMDRANFGHNIFKTGQYQPGVTVPMTYGNDSFLNCQYGIRRSSNPAQDSAADPIENHIGGWTSGNFLFSTPQPYDPSTLNASTSLAVSAADVPTYPESLYPNVYAALTSTATAVRRTQVDADNFPTTIGPGDVAGTTAPSVTTTAASSITPTSAIAGGIVVSDGGASVTGRGTCYSPSANPTTPCTSDGTGTGSFTSSLTGLTISTLYHIRAFATNSVGTSYGSDGTFTTSSAPTAPTVTTTAASSITATTAVTGGNVTSDGGSSVTSRGVCYSTSSNPTSPCTSNGTGTGVFSASLSGLTGSTLYHIRSFATNAISTSYGSDLTFTTSAPPAPPNIIFNGHIIIGGQVTIK